MFSWEAVKLSAAATNLGIAWALGHPLLMTPVMLAAGLVGFFGYGISLVLFVLALRHLGTARAGAYFSVAPFAGAALAITLQHETVTMQVIAAGALMAVGVWLHMTERHGHRHTHERVAHEHVHTHDEHHRHDHDPSWDGRVPHAHPHVHMPIEHSHAHYPDLHHRHGIERSPRWDGPAAGHATARLRLEDNSATTARATSTQTITGPLGRSAVVDATNPSP
jgi:hypothetical protein